MGREYWKDFFSAIVHLIIYIIFGSIASAVCWFLITITPLWVIVGIFILFAVWLYAHESAVSKQERRKEIDDEIARLEEDINHKEDIIACMYNHIANAKPQENTSDYVLEIENAEGVIAHHHQTIERLLIERNLV